MEKLFSILIFFSFQIFSCGAQLFPVAEIQSVFRNEGSKEEKRRKREFISHVYTHNFKDNGAASTILYRRAKKHIGKGAKDKNIGLCEIGYIRLYRCNVAWKRKRGICWVPSLYRCGHAGLENIYTRFTNAA